MFLLSGGRGGGGGGHADFTLLTLNHENAEKATHDGEQRRAATRGTTQALFRKNEAN